MLEVKESEFNRLIIILPYAAFDKIKEMKTNVVQFFHTYGSYRINAIEGNNLLVEGDYDEGVVKKSISKDELLKLQAMSIKPLGIPFKFVYIKDNHVSPEAKQRCIWNNLKNLLKSETFMDESGGWIKGIDFYRYVSQVLINSWDRDFNKVAKYVFLQSIQNGSSFFYRREFNESLDNEFAWSENGLTTSGNLWRKLSRYLKSRILEEKYLEENWIMDTMNEIGKTELTAFHQILAKEGELKNVISY